MSVSTFHPFLRRRWLLISAFQLLSFSAFQLNAQTIFVPGGSVGSSGNTNVGIGLSTPGYPLDVQGPDIVGTRVSITSGSTNVTSGVGTPLLIQNRSATPGNFAATLYYDANYNLQGSIGMMYGAHTGPNQGSFYIEPRIVATPTTFVVTPPGRVGIGTNTPSSALEVNGDLTLTSNFNSIRFMSAAGPGDLYLDADPGTRMIRTRNWNVNGPNIPATGFHTGTLIAETMAGIGTTAPGATLDVVGNIRGSGGFAYRSADGTPWWFTGSVNGPAMMFQSHALAGGATNRRGSLGWMDNLGNKGEWLTWIENGNVGIGTTAPQAGLSVVGASAVEIGGTAASNVFRVSGKTLGSSAGDSVTIASFGTIDGIANQTSLGISNWRVSDGDNYLSTGVMLSADVDDTPRVNNGYLFIGNNGGVGIGTTSPTSRLTVSGDISVASEYYGLRFPMNLGVSGGIVGDDGSYKTLKLYNGNSIRFGIGNDPSYTNEKMRIDGAGNVGIGTTAPGAKLDVAGDTRVSGNLTIGGTLTAPGYTASTGVISGGASGLALTAGGTNQNVTLSPSGTGATILNGNVGIGTTPTYKLQIAGNNAGQPQVPDFSLDTNAWFNFGHDTGYGYIGWFTQGTGTGFVNTHSSVSPTLIRASNGALTIYSSISTGFGSPSNFFPELSVTATGVAIGTTTADTALTVKGTIHASEVVVDAKVTAKVIRTNDVLVQPKAWADDVFGEGHPLQPLSAVEQSIKEHKHLPGVPSAQEVAANGVSVADMQTVLLQKIEELTLHQIEQEKRIQKLEAENAALRKRDTQ